MIIEYTVNQSTIRCEYARVICVHFLAEYLFVVENLNYSEQLFSLLLSKFIFFIEKESKQKLKEIAIQYHSNYW